MAGLVNNEMLHPATSVSGVDGRFLLEIQISLETSCFIHIPVYFLCHPLLGQMSQAGCGLRCGACVQMSLSSQEKEIERP